MAVVTHITGRDASRSSKASVAAIGSYLMVSANVKPSKTGAKAIRRWEGGGGGGGGRGVGGGGGCGVVGREGVDGRGVEGRLYIHNKIYT